MESIWTETAQQPRFGALEGNYKTDVLVIGGGIAGILCAYQLQRAGVRCALIEAERICGGVTQNTTAKITLQHGLIYSQTLCRYGEETARLYFEAQKGAMSAYEELCRTVDCDYEACDSFVYSRSHRDRIEQEIVALNKIGCRAAFTEHLPIPLSVAGAVRISGQAQLHPLKFLFAIARDLTVFEHTKALEICEDGVLTNRGKIKAQKIIVATHFPFLNKHGMFFLKLYQHRSYVIALENAPRVNGIYVDEAADGLSFRNYGGQLLLGGGSHRTGKKGGGWQELTTFAKSYYPNTREVARWATQDCMTLDGIPYIGQYSPHTPNLYVASGFHKCGMTSSMVAAMLLCDLVLGRKNMYASVFSPSRSILHPQLAVNAAESLIGMLRPTVPRCPHLGCALKYNPQEHSWDCSCHGSRFHEKGRLLDGPAQKDKRL